MSEWIEKKISEIGNTSSGGTPSRAIPSYFTGNIPWVTTSELNDNYINDTIEKITVEALYNSSAKLFPKGTILMAMYGATIGKLGILDIEATTNQACCALFFNEDIDSLFMYHLLLYSRAKIIELGSGAGQSNISQKIIRELKFKIPTSIIEQQKIAEILTTADKAITASRALLEKYTAVKLGLLQDLLGNGKPTKLIKVGKIIVSGVDKHIHQNEIPVRLCNYMDVYNNRYITDDLPFSKGSVKSSEFKRFALRDGDVIFTKDSETPNDIGIPAVVCGNPKSLVCGYHLAMLRPFKDKYSGKFVMFALQTQNCKNYFGVMATGMTRFGMKIESIENQVIFAPPLAEQQRIAEILTAADNRITAEQKHLAKLEKIKLGLMLDNRRGFLLIYYFGGTNNVFFRIICKLVKNGFIQTAQNFYRRFSSYPCFRRNFADKIVFHGRTCFLSIR